jgi:hypothetical protein
MSYLYSFRANKGPFSDTNELANYSDGIQCHVN